MTRYRLLASDRAADGLETEVLARWPASRHKRLQLQTADGPKVFDIAGEESQPLFEGSGGWN